MHTIQPSGAIFVRLENGLNGQKIAVFFELDREISLCKSDIEARIRNLAKYGHPCIAEHAALAELKRQAVNKIDA